MDCWLLASFRANNVLPLGALVVAALAVCGCQSAAPAPSLSTQSSVAVTPTPTLESAAAPNTLRPTVTASDILVSSPVQTPRPTPPPTIATAVPVAPTSAPTTIVVSPAPAATTSAPTVVDREPPTLVAISASPLVVGQGGMVVVTATVTDVGSGVLSVGVCYAAPLGCIQPQLVAGTPLSGIYSTSVAVPTTWLGTYPAVITIFDKAGNQVSYQTQVGLAYTTPASGPGKGWSTMLGTGATITVR